VPDLAAGSHARTQDLLETGLVSGVEGAEDGGGLLEQAATDSRESQMPNPIVHVEIIGRDPAALRDFYARLFGWSADTDSPVAPEISDAGNYGFIEPPEAGAAVAGGIGGGAAFRPHTVFYVGVDDVGGALKRAETLGAIRVLGPAANPNGSLVVGQFTDPEGNLVGVAGPV